MKEPATILIVDDDKDLGEMLSIVLQTRSYRPVTCTDGSRAVEIFPTVEPDLVLLDIMLPGMDGIGIARWIRSRSNVPIIMLTAKSDTKNIVEGLEAGADDYVVKPFSTDELLARIHARLRPVSVRTDQEGQESLAVIHGLIEINRQEHTAVKRGRQLSLTPTEFELLYVLASHPGEVLSRGELLRKVWDYQDMGDTRLVNVHVQRLRQKIEDDPENPRIIETVRGIGYKYAAEQPGS